MLDCIFCKIIRGDIPCEKIYEDEDTFAFLDSKPVNPGHTLVIPKKHSEDIISVDEKEWLAVMKTAKKIAHAIEVSLRPAGINIGMNNRAPAGQVVFHAHVHVMPRSNNDGYELWHGKPYGDGEAAKMKKKVVAAL